jgi:hypothetical protein
MGLPKVRRRVVSDYSSTNNVFAYWQGDGFTSETLLTNNWPSLTRHSIINDVVGTSKTQRVKPVLHETARYVGLPLLPFYADNNLVVRFNRGVTPKLPFGNPFGDSMLTVPHSVRVQAAGRAFTSFSERFPTLVSGAEFTQGLMELSALLPKLERTITQTISSGFLTKKFGWDNLLSDLETLSSAIGSIRKRMEFLKRTYGKPTKLYYREPNVHIVDKTTWDEFHLRGYEWRYTLESYRCDFVASASLLQRLDHIDDFIGWLRAIVISLGLNNPLLAIWQTTRLSFVIDWFVDVSAHLARLAAVQPAEEWNVSNVSSTLVWTARVSVTQMNRNLFGGVSDQISPLGYYDFKLYERLVGLPVDLTIFTPSTCTPDQLVLMLAMAGAK